MPEVHAAPPRERLSQLITDADQVAAMTKAELVDMEAAHDREIVIVQGVIETRVNPAEKRKFVQTLRVLQLHRKWIVDELAHRKKAEHTDLWRAHVEARRSAAAAARFAAEEATRRRQAEHAARLERIAAANDEDQRQIRVFKAVAREVLGQDMYAHLWELTRQRLAANGGADA